jgi:hypothetical protein
MACGTNMTSVLTDQVVPLVKRDVLTVRANALGYRERRFDAESWLSVGHGLRQRISQIETASLSSLADVWQPSRLKSVLVSQEHGLPYIAATQVFDTRPVARKWIAGSHTPELDRLYVQHGWILVTRSGAVGDAIVAHRAHENIVISDDLLRVVPKKLSDRGYIYSFLRTKHAREILRGTKYGNVIKHLEVDHLAHISIPIVGDNKFRLSIDSKIRRCYELRDEAIGLVESAESLFAKAIGPTPTPHVETGFSIRAREMFGAARRMNGESFNPEAVAALLALKKSGKSVELLRYITSSIFGVTRFKHIYTNTGIPYIDSGELFVVNPELHKFIPKNMKTDAVDYYVEDGWLLMACSGQTYGIIGDAVLSNHWHKNKIISNHVIRIVPNDKIRAGYLLTVLTHPVFGRPLVLRLAFGTSVPEIGPLELKNMPIVRLGALETKIADKVERANELRAMANTLEDEATVLIETEVSRAIGELTENECNAIIANIRLDEP